MLLNFLPLRGWGGAEILPLAGDASFRRYFRVVDGERSAVLMDAPPPHEDPRPFVAVAEWLAWTRPQRAEILARDLERGAACCSAISATGGCASFWTRSVARARTLRARDRRADPPSPSTRRCPALSPHGLDQWLEELKLFTDWYCPAVGADVDADSYRAAWTRGAGARRRRRARPGDRPSRLSRRERDARRGPRGRRRISGCSISRTRSPGTRRMTSRRCSRMLGATCRRRSSGR